jgi:hypothetical protein
MRLSHQIRVMKRPTIHNPKAEGRLAGSRYSAAFMSDTKWRKALTAIQQSDLCINKMTVKFIDADDPRTMRFPPSLGCPRAYIDTIEFGPTALRSIEWMEFQADLEPILRTIGRFQMEVSTGRTRIVGYTA